jgi:bacteriorhodopsin
MIIMWYVMVFAVMIVGAIAVAAYLLAFMLLDGVVPNPEAWAIAAAVAVFVGVGYLGASSDKVRGKKNGR